MSGSRAVHGSPTVQVVGSAEVEDRMMALLDFGIPDSGFCCWLIFLTRVCDACGLQVTRGAT